MPSQSKSGREEKQYNYRLISSCVLPVLDGEKVHIGRMSATLRCERCRDRFYISRYVFIRFEQKQHTLKEYPYENGRFSPVKFWAYEILSYICTPERV